MKKTYVKPAIETYKLELQYSLLDGSIEISEEEFDEADII